MKTIQLVLIQFVLINFFFVSSAFAQEIELTENEPTRIYSLPKSEINIQLELEKTNTKPGIYYQYSERYLATNQIAMEEKTTYRLKSIAIATKAIADEKRTYSIHPSRKSAFNQLSVNEKGILCGINVACKPLDTFTDETSIFQNTETVNVTTLLPLGEEYMMAGSVAKLAEGAAKQIYRIRESRLSLLTGDLEHAPADGASMQTMLEALTKSENGLTELFTGKTTTTVEKKIISLPIDSAIDEAIAFRLSAFKGVVAVDDLSGNPYFVRIKTEKIKTIPVSVSKSGKSEVQTINTIYPAKSTIELTDGITTICTLNTELPQFGVVIPLSADMIGSTTTKVHIDPTNGRLLYIEK